ncbi:MAG: AP2 domain-containing protein [Bacteroidales bacterium]|jgi:hypothetical protein
MKRYGHLFKSIYEPNEIIITGDIAKIMIAGQSPEIMAVATINVDDVEKCKTYKWHIHSGGYIATSIKGNTLLLHTLITGSPYVDHANRDKTDNRKENLRPCTESQNQGNKISSPNRQQYKGVSWHSIAKRWRARIKHNRCEKHLGLFDTPIEAAMAYDKKAKELFGEFARLNIIQEEAQS